MYYTMVQKNTIMVLFCKCIPWYTSKETWYYWDMQVHLKKFEYREKVFCNLFQKVKLSYILD